MRATILVGCVFWGCGFGPASSVLDAPIDAVGDQDNDGILDNVDNCPTKANPDQRDHDGDGRGDACDLCPHIATATDVDTDGDGIGDACDPEPMKGSDRLVLWEGFYDPASIATWTEAGAAANWTVMNGAVHQDSSAAGDRTLSDPTTFQRLSVDVGFVVGAVGPNGLVGVCSGVSGGSQIYCCTLQAQGAGARLYVTSTFPGTNDPETAAWSGTFATGDRVRLTQSFVGTNQCTASQGAATAVKSASLGPTPGKLELYTATAGAAFDYVFIVELGN